MSLASPVNSGAGRRPDAEGRRRITHCVAVADADEHGDTGMRSTPDFGPRRQLLRSPVGNCVYCGVVLCPSRKSHRTPGEPDVTHSCTRPSARTTAKPASWLMPDGGCSGVRLTDPPRASSDQRPAPLNPLSGDPSTGSPTAEKRPSAANSTCPVVPPSTSQVPRSEDREERTTNRGCASYRSMRLHATATMSAATKEASAARRRHRVARCFPSLTATPPQPD